MSIFEISAVVGITATIIGALIAFYKKVNQPENSIDLINQRCLLKHQSLDADVTEIKDSVKLIKENHLRHIESDVSELKMGQTKILTILEAKYQIKIN